MIYQCGLSMYSILLFPFRQFKLTEPYQVANQNQYPWILKQSVSLKVGDFLAHFVFSPVPYLEL